MVRSIVVKVTVETDTSAFVTYVVECMNALTEYNRTACIKEVIPHMISSYGGAKFSDRRERLEELLKKDYRIRFESLRVEHFIDSQELFYAGNRWSKPTVKFHCERPMFFSDHHEDIECSFMLLLVLEHIKSWIVGGNDKMYYILYKW